MKVTNKKPIKPRKKITLFFFFTFLFCFQLSTTTAEELISTKEGKFYGAKTATHPDWFKQSFLDLEEDIDDATALNKRLVLYFWQPGCPYCNQLWEENFSRKDVEKKFRDNFEIIAINIWGNRDVISVSGKDYTEKAFSEALNIQYTPTLLFFDEKKKVIHRLNGYIPPEDFKLSIEYVAAKREKVETFGKFSSNQKQVNKKSLLNNLHGEDFFDQENNNNLNRTKPFEDKFLAVFFEAKDCDNCDLLHKKTLKDPTTRKLITQFQSVQLDRYSDHSLTTPSGKQTTVKEWANKLDISYLPSIIFFNKKGSEIMRIDAQMRSFHIQSVFDYVLSKSYETEKNFQRYLSSRAEKLRKKGIDVDIWAY